MADAKKNSPKRHKLILMVELALNVLVASALFRVNKGLLLLLPTSLNHCSGQPVKRVLIWALLSLFLCMGWGSVQAQTYFGNQSAYSSPSSFPLSSAGVTYDARFTMPTPTRNLTSVQIAGYLTGSCPTYQLILYQDDGTANHFHSATQAGIGVNSTFGGSYYSGSPAWGITPQTLTAGLIYHLVVNYISGTVDAADYFAPGYSIPNFQYIPATQALDPYYNLLGYSAGAWTTIGGSPTFILGFSDGSYFGDPWDTYNLPQVYGNGGTANYAGEVFQLTTGDLYTSQVSVWVGRTGSPADNLYFTLEDQTMGVTLSQGFFAPFGAVNTVPGWVTGNFNGILRLTNGHTFRLWFSSPSSTGTAYYSFPSGATTSAPASLSYDSTNSYMTNTTTGGSFWSTNSSADMGFRFNIATAPTATPTPVSNPYFGDQSVGQLPFGSFPLNSTTQRFDYRFTLRGSRTVNTLYLGGSSLGTPVTYTVGLQQDDGTGKPNGTFIVSSNVTLGNYFSNNTINIPPIPLVDGTVYHMVIQWSGLGPAPSGSNYFSPNYGNTYYNYVPFDQYPDPQLNVMSDTGSGFAQGVGGVSKTPMFGLGDISGSYFGVPFDTYGYGNFINGNGTIPQNDDNESAEYFQSTSAVPIQVDKVGVWASWRGTIPADSLYYRLEDLTQGVTMDQGILAKPAAGSSTTSWLEAKLPFPMIILPGDQYRLSLRSPGSVSPNDWDTIMSANTVGLYSATYNGLNSYFALSSTGDTGFGSSSAYDLNFRFQLNTSPTPTITPIPTITPTPQAGVGAGWSQDTTGPFFPPHFGHSSVAFPKAGNPAMWVIGGQGSSGVTNDTWYSLNGTGWNLANANCAFPARSNQTSVVFQGKMWVIGGYNGASYLNDVWNSSDGVNWTSVPQTAPFTNRGYHASVVYNNRIWVVGGYGGSYLNDVWCSSDGANWTQVTAAAPWQARNAQSMVVFDAGTGSGPQMWLIGGINSGGSAMHDVWYSSDGANWIQATANAAFPIRYAHSSVVYGNQMWVIGGYGGSYLQDVWSSSNGLIWNLATGAAFPVRAYQSSLVFNNQLWALGGSNGSPLNEVWFSPAPPPISWFYNSYIYQSGGSSNAGIWQTVNGAAETTDAVTLSYSGGSIPLPYNSIVNISGTNYAKYSNLVNFPYTPGQAYTITSVTSQGTATGSGVAPGGFTFAPDGSGVTWAVNGNSYSSVQVLDPSSTQVFTNTGTGISPVAIPGSTYTTYGNYTFNTEVQSTAVLNNLDSNSAMIIYQFGNNTYNYAAPTATPTATPTPPAWTYSISSSVTYTGASPVNASFPIMVMVGTDPNPQNFAGSNWYAQVTVNGANFTVQVPSAGTYYLTAYLDTFSSNQYQPAPGDPYVYFSQQYTKPLAGIAVSGTAGIAAVTIDGSHLMSGVTGVMTYNGAQGTLDNTHPGNVGVFFDANLLYSALNGHSGNNRVSSSGSSYSIPLDPGAYYMNAYVDENNNQKEDTGEPYQIYNGICSGSGSPVVVAANSVVPVNFPLSDTCTNYNTPTATPAPANQLQGNVQYTEGRALSVRTCRSAFS